MNRQTLNDDEEEPLDPAVERVRRKLVRFIAINLGLLFLALMAVVGALVYKSLTATPRVAVAQETPPPEGVLEGRIAVPAGARIVSQSLSGNRLSLSLELADGKRTVYIYDIQAGRMIGRFAIVEE